MIEYVRVQNLKPGDVIAKSLYDEMGRILLKGGRELTEMSIRVITQYGYKGIYIRNNSEIRRELVPVPEPLIDDIIWFRMVNVLRSIYHNTDIQFDPYNRQFMADKKKLHDLIVYIVETLQEADANNKLLFELEDGRNMNTWIYFHSINVCLLSIGIAIKLGLSKQEIIEVALGAIYHDMGKAWIPTNIINKTGLTEQEKMVVRSHADNMFRFLQKHNYTVNTLYAVWQHHEKIDGTGYPSGIKKGKIVQSARIVSCANMYDNYVNMNPYEGVSMYQADAIEYLSASGGQDFECMRALLQIVMPYPIGTRVRLSDGTEALIVKNVPNYPLRPIVIANKELVRLNSDSEYLNITITEVIK